MDPKNKASEEPNKRLNEPIFAGATARVGSRVGRKKKGKFFSKRSFWICFSNIEIGSKLQTKDKEITKKTEFKAKDGFLISNVGIGTEEDKEEVLLALEKMKKNKSCFMTLLLEHRGGEILMPVGVDFDLLSLIHRRI